MITLHVAHDFLPPLKEEGRRAAAGRGRMHDATLTPSGAFGATSPFQGEEKWGASS